MLFDYLVSGQILAINPVHAMRRPKHSVKRGKTPVLSARRRAICSTAWTSRPSSVGATALVPLNPLV